MACSANRRRALAAPSLSHIITTVVAGAAIIGRSAQASQVPKVKFHWEASSSGQFKRGSAAKREPTFDDWDGKVPLNITNNCDSTIWPGITSQAGSGPGTGGFELGPGEQRGLWVSPDWQGRVWGRTNCTVDGDSCQCMTGDCFGKLDCEFSGATPATLAEFTLSGGIEGMQTFYDLSLVDGYNIPMGINYIPAENTTFIPPNLTNCACIATAGWLYSNAGTGTYYTNSSYPVPLETYETNDDIRNWCPWPYLKFPPTKPGDGIYPYPDDHIERPTFSPCNSACAATGSDRDCCEGEYRDPNICRPSAYSQNIKAICPDAYSFAFDDQSSTFIIPKGGGWEVVMCPEGRSTNILRQLGAEMSELANSGTLSEATVDRLKNATYVQAVREAAGIALLPAWGLAATGALLSIVFISM
ncbi:thaumatin family protein [Stachybotrys elegans]|uniref:Thaumatin family protein n=1 Tax=Stachybotrys elegans TaxID=80388 RepID=A0A8K0WQ56_9HYPO|nr:thaumatin family protein [Stachybotrys elegans]